MKKILSIILLLFVTINSQSQNLKWVAFDTNGPMGECLFPQNEDGEIVYSEVVPCSLSADTIMGLAKEFMYDIGKSYNADCKIELEGVTKLACRVKLPVGKEYISLGDLALWERCKSEISFDMLIEIREGRYRYTLINFYTERRRIPGEGKNDGPSNMIHWQRVNSLKKEMPLKDTKRIKREDYERMIEAEQLSYQGEYNAVQAVIQGLKTFTTINDDFW